jgi:peptide/nickel transport system ATP-binding protein
MTEQSHKLLDIKNLNIWYSTSRGESKAVNGLDLEIHRGEIFGLAGESGCGKSTFISGLMRMVKLPAHIQSGEIFFTHADRAGNYIAEDLLTMSLEEMRELRWRNISYIPQSAMNVLNPVLNIEDQIIDVARTHSDMTKTGAGACPCAVGNGWAESKRRQNVSA